MLPRWQRATILPPTDIFAEGRLVETVEPLVDPGVSKPFAATFPAVDRDGDGWIEIRIKASRRPLAGGNVSADEWEQQLAGNARNKRVFANALWQYDVFLADAAALLAGKVAAPRGETGGTGR